jgi:hypothetical protein
MWMAELAELNLNQGKAAVEGMLAVVNQAADGFVHQTSVVREQCVSLAEATTRNIFDLGDRIIQTRNLQEWVEAQSEFMSKQANAFAGCTTKTSERLSRELREACSTLPEAKNRSAAAW